MEPELAGEESVDSIPRPEYEAISGASDKSLPALPMDRLIAVPVIDDETVEVLKPHAVRNEGTDDDDDDDDYDDGDDEDCEEDTEAEYSERDEELKAEKDMAATYAPSTIDVAPSRQQEVGSAAVPTQLKLVSQNQAGVPQYSIVVSNKTTVGVSDGGSDGGLTGEKKICTGPVPVQILAAVTAPKTVPAKTKHNKLVMVLPPAVNTSSGSITTDVPEQTAAPKLASPVEDKAGLNSQQRTVRSSTPLSREFLALQRSVNESKVLSEFVTDTAVAKVRNRRKSGIIGQKDSSMEHTPGKREDNSQQVVAGRSLERRKSAVSMAGHVTESALGGDMHGGTTSLPNSADKLRRAGKLVPLKDDEEEIELKPTQRSRSKSVHRKSPVAGLESAAAALKLKRWPSDEKILKRTNMRSQNSEFVQKQMEFLNRVMEQQRDDGEASDGDDEQYMNGEDEESNLADSSINESNVALMGQYPSSGFRQALSSMLKTEITSSNCSVSGPDADSLETRLKAVWQPPPKRGWDSFCWKCRECGDLIACSKCVRSFHSTCIKTTAATKLDSTWLCPECVMVENVLNGPKSRTRRNELSLDLLSQLLSFALKRMRNVKGYTKFLYSSEELAQYSKYIVNPVTFVKLQEMIEKRVFRCAEEYLNETKWMLHNALILSHGLPNNKEALTAKAVLKICRQETNEIDTCAECYLNANTRADWFVDVCAQPHLLLWAKLKGFPYWPAKAMGPGQGSHVNVRFFGEHDRAFVPVKDCFLYSQQDPNTQTGKRSARELADCIKEVEVHIEKIKAKVGAFKYATYKTPYEPVEEMQQLEQMMPGVTEYMKRQQTLVAKPSLQYKIVKTADNHLSIIKKAIATESGNDSDHSGSPSKKAKSESGEMKLTTTKYEVVSKATSEDSNSSKVSAVILKRKSDGSEHKKSEEPELPMPKMTKIDEVEKEQRVPMPQTSATVAISTKRKYCAEAGKEAESERHKSKHSKHTEPRVPMLTIKTNGNKSVEAKQENESKDTTAESDAQSMMENLVKNKQGVTIKKISKESGKKATTAAEATAPSTTEAEKKEVTANSSNNTEETKNAHKVTNILKDLVPFVEIKKEITSDEEEVANAGNSSINANANVSATTPAGPSPPSLPTPAPAVTQTTLTTPAAGVAQEPWLLTTVKQEVMSDDEEKVNAQSNDSNVSIIDPPAGLVITERTIASQVATNDTVRVVGDTTIQRIPTKSANNAAQNFQQSNSSTTAVNTSASGAAAAQPQTAGATSMSASKRGTTRGVPYGPLPASASPTVKSPATASPNFATNNTNSNVNNLNLQQQQQLQQLRQGQRARKSFPNRSSTEFSPARSQPASTSVAPATLPPSSIPAVTTNNDIKRSLLKTSMVSIPRQSWSPMELALTGRSGGNGNNNSTIPVPPLTAVSKHTTPATTNSESNTNNNTSVAIVTATDAASVPTFVNCNGGVGGVIGGNAVLAPLSMSAPPPLAGLSQPTISVSTVSCASSIAANAPAMVSLANSTSATTSTASALDGGHGVVATTTPTMAGITGGDFVTPTLAAMVTDAICRGPPKMAARPNGPLQSDGTTMFPSQAGPVCRTLVENAHKLTDFFISVMEDTMLEMSVGDESVLQAKITLLTMELERRKQSYEQEIAELKRTSDLMLCEMRKSMENEKTRLANEIRKQCELERLRSVEETKKKQWCANCGREAQFYCCWNTSYCDYPCQQLHWSRHAPNCAQTRPSSNSSSDGQATTLSITAGGGQSGGGKQQSNTASGTPPHYNKTVINSKKEKSTLKSSQASTMGTGSVTGGALITATTAAEVLKLPSNTYVRTVPQGSGNVRGSAFAVPVQRFNIPLPITAPVNAPPPYTLVQRGNSWELTSAAAAANNAPPAMNASNIATVSATVATITPTVAQLNTHQQHQQQQQQQQSRHISNNANVQTQKGGARNRSMQSLGTLHGSTLQCNVLRPTQM